MFSTSSRPRWQLGKLVADLPAQRQLPQRTRSPTPRVDTPLRINPLLRETGNDTVTLTVNQGAYQNSPLSSKTVTVILTATGIVNMTSITLGSTPTAPASFASTVTVPFDGEASSAVTGLAARPGDVVPVIGTAATAGVPVTYTTTDGFLSTDSSTEWDKGKKTVTATSGSTVYFFSTKTGSVSVSATGWRGFAVGECDVYLACSGSAISASLQTLRRRGHTPPHGSC